MFVDVHNAVSESLTEFMWFPLIIMVLEPEFEWDGAASLRGPTRNARINLRSDITWRTRCWASD